MVRLVGRCALLALSLCACGGDDDEAPGGDGGGGECLAAGDCARVDGTAGDGVTHGFAVAVAPDGDVLVAGLMSGNVTFGAGGPNETTVFSGSNDVFVARYDDCGLVWVTRLLTRGVGGNPALASSGAVLEDGSFAVVGQFTGEVVFAPESDREQTLDAEGSQSEAFVLLVNPQGQPAWIARSVGIGADTASGVTVAGGTVGITGSYGLSDAGGPIFMTLGEGETNETTLESTEGTMQVFIARYDGAGRLVWARRAVSAGTSDSFARSATTADNGDVVIGGTSLGSSITFAPGEPEETVLDGAGSFLARYSAGGTFRWAMPSTVAGSVTAVTSLPGGDFAIAAVTTSEGRLARHDPEGNLRWLEEIRPRSAALDEPIPSGLATLEDGTLVVTGVFAGGALFGIDGPEQTELDATGTTDAFVAAYDPAGTLVWAERAGGGDDDRGASIAATPDGGLVWTGQLSDDATFFADSCPTAASGPDQLLVRVHR